MSTRMNTEDTALALSADSGITVASGGLLGAYEPESLGGGARAIGLVHLMRFKWTAILITALVAAISIPAIWALTVPEYAAHALVRVAPNIPKLVYKTDENGQIYAYTPYLYTQCALIMAPKLLQEVIEEPDVQRTKWFSTRA